MRAETQANPAATQADTMALEAWYDKDFLPRLDKVAGSHTPLEGLGLRSGGSSACDGR
jgi:hypothetical protein